MEEPVHGHAQRVPHTRHRPERVRPHPQVRLLAQILKRVPLGLDGILVRIVDPPRHPNPRRRDFRTALAGSWHDRAVALDRAPGAQLGHLARVVGQVPLRHDLDRVKARPVVQRDEREPAVRLRVSPRPHPSLHRHGQPKSRKMWPTSNTPRKGTSLAALRRTTHVARRELDDRFHPRPAESALTLATPRATREVGASPAPTTPAPPHPSSAPKPPHTPPRSPRPAA
jgi:hypothetical protein